jgi:hypothetical protein
VQRSKKKAGKDSKAEVDGRMAGKGNASVLDRYVSVDQDGAGREDSRSTWRG